MISSSDGMCERGDGQASGGSARQLVRLSDRGGGRRHDAECDREGKVLMLFDEGVLILFAEGGEWDMEEDGEDGERNGDLSPDWKTERTCRDTVLS